MGRNSEDYGDLTRNRGRSRIAGLFLDLGLSLSLLLSACTTSPVNHYNRGVDFQDRGDFLEAMREYRRAIELNPQDPSPRFNLAVLYQDHGKPAEAKEQYQAILAKHPDYAPAWVNLSAIQEQEGDLQAAELSLDRAIQADRDNPFPVSQKGFFLLKRDRISEAREAFQESLRRDAAWANGHFGLGRVAEAQGDPVGALGHYEEASRRNPLDVEARMKVADLSISRGNKEDAIPHLRRAAELDPERGETFFALGLLLQEAGRWRAAVDAYERALHLGINPARCHLALSQLHERLAMEELRAYERELQRGLSSPPGSPTPGASATGRQTGDRPSK
jgi:tetratricopeptide (TPR) repeat protein